MLVLEYCAGGNLQALIQHYKRLNEGLARVYMCELQLALEHLHARGIVYRDLKPDNVVLDAAGHAYLTDFGLSKENVLSEFLQNSRTNSFCGSV